MKEIHQATSFEMTVAEHMFEETVASLALALFSKKVETLTFDEASQLIAFLYDQHANPDSGKITNDGHEVADSKKDGNEVVSAIMRKLRAELSRLSLEGSEAIISVKESIATDQGTYVKGTRIVRQLRFPRIPHES